MWLELVLDHEIWASNAIACDDFFLCLIWSLPSVLHSYLLLIVICDDSLRHQIIYCAFSAHGLFPGICVWPLLVLLFIWVWSTIFMCTGIFFSTRVIWLQNWIRDITEVCTLFTILYAAALTILIFDLMFPFLQRLYRPFCALPKPPQYQGTLIPAISSTILFSLQLGTYLMCLLRIWFLVSLQNVVQS
jgi:hypothetical protein